MTPCCFKYGIKQYVFLVKDTFNHLALFELGRFHDLQYAL